MRAAWTRALVMGLIGAVWAPAIAQAQIFKYQKPDGTVAYTDKLSDLPKERRAYYNRLLAERAKKDEAVEKSARETDAAIRAAEAERQRLARERMAADERRRRLAALDETLESLRERNRAREQAKQKWQQRVAETRKALEDALTAYRATKEKWQALAIRADFALFPGQVEEKQELRAQMQKLEGEVDALVHQLDVVIPEEARKAGVPPGWLR